jgi:hypothetical protein
MLLVSYILQHVFCIDAAIGLWQSSVIGGRKINGQNSTGD